MIIQRVLFRFGMFQSIPVNKIKQNQIIQKFNNQGEMIKYFEQNRSNLNLINLVSYIRKYTDFMIQKEMVNDKEQMNHTFQVLEQLQNMVSQREYIKFGDQEKDHKRAFIMLLSLSVEMIQQCPQKKRFLEYGKLAIMNLKSLNYISKCNPQELSVFLRCITQIEELTPTEEEELEYWFLVKKYYPECNGNLCCKYLQSLSKFNSINESIVTGIMDKIAVAKDYNLKDLVSLFGSFKHIGEKCPNLMGKIEMIIQEQQVNLIQSNARLDVKQIGMIYNGMFNLNMNCEEGFNEYLMRQLGSQKKLSLLCLAHVFQYHSKKELKVGEGFRDQVYKYLENYQLNNYKDTEQYLMFFHDYIPYISNDFLELNYKILCKAKFNDFGLGKLFSSLTLLKQPDSQIKDLCNLAINTLQNYDQPINVHALNSILRARCILNGSKSNQIVETVQIHLEKAGKQIINEEFNHLISKQKYFKALEFLQVLVDLLKVLEDSCDIKPITPILEELIKQISSVKNVVFQQNVSRYPDIIKCYI